MRLRTMLSIAALGTALIVPTLAHGQARPIAYTEVGGRDKMSLHLSYADGSGKILLHTTSYVGRPAMRPGSAQVAFLNSTDCSCIQLLTYEDGSTGGRVISVETLAPRGASGEFSPDGSKFVYTYSATNEPPEIRWMSMSDRISHTLVSGHYAKDFGWVAEDRLVYLVDGEGPDKVVELKLNADMSIAASQVVYETANIDGMGEARTRNAVFLGHSTQTGIYIRELDLGAPDDLTDAKLLSNDIAWGAFPESSPNDAFVLYKGKDYYLRRINLLTGDSTIVARSKSFRQHDWRR